MDPALLLKNLNKLHNICNFLSKIEIYLFVDQKNLSTITKSLRISLEKSLVNFAFDIQKKIEILSFRNRPTVEISNDIKNILNQVYEIIIQLKIRNYDELKQDMDDIVLFMQMYEEHKSFIFITKDAEELKDLQEKLLEIISKRFG